jgi:Asp-tRNA(Asn)/Glu-tRNA(Gln) amidotransferase A subunit family amidase
VAARSHTGVVGLVGLKATYGRIPLTPNARLGAMTVTHGCLSRSVRDTARWFDVCNGRDPREPLSLPRVEGWEAGLGTHLDELAASARPATSTDVRSWSCRVAGWAPTKLPVPVETSNWVRSP